MKLYTQLSATIVLLVSLSFSFVACNKENDDIILATHLTLLSPTAGAIEVEYISGDHEVKFLTDGSWVTHQSSDWYTVSPQSGDGSGNVIISFSENQSGDTRKDTLTITAGVHVSKIPVIQKKYSELVVSPNLLEFSQEGGVLEFSVVSVFDWEITETPTWISSVDKTAGTSGTTVLKVTAEKNTTNIEQIGDIVIKSKNLPTEVLTRLRLKQNYQNENINKNVFIDKEHILVTKDGAQRILTITSDEVAWAIEDIPSWINTNLTSGVGTKNITVTVDPNAGEPRTATMNIVVNNEVVNVFTLDQWSADKGVITSRGGYLHQAVSDVGGVSLKKLTVLGALNKSAKGVDDIIALADIIRSTNEVDMSEATLNSSEGISQAWQRMNSNLKLIKLPKTSFSAVPIGTSAFEGCANLATIEIPEGYTLANSSSVFANCVKLRIINLPTTVGEIGSQVFEGCTSLESIIIPEGVKVIGEGAFLKCSKLTTVKFPTTLTTIESSAFNFNHLASIDLPANLVTIGSNAFSNNGNISSKLFFTVTLSESVTLVGASAFYNNPRLRILHIYGQPQLSPSAFFLCNYMGEIYAYTSTPPDCDVNASPFEPHHYKNSLVFVPKASSATYASHPVWKSFAKRGSK